MDAVKKPFISGLVEAHVDAKVYQDVIKTHAKEAITLLDYGNLAITNVDPRTISRAQFTECEISPFHKHDLACTTDVPAQFSRQPSTSRFAAKPIHWHDLQTLLIHAFGADDNQRRSYPSAGGLYPVEPIVFLFQEHIHSQTLVSGAYHFRSVSKILQLIQKIEADYFFDKLLHGLIDTNHTPCVAILYLAHVGKAIFKYRYRGYRHALMEAGSMYQQALIVAQHMGLRSTAWSSFGEHELLHALDLDYGTYLPLTMQLFGYEDCA